jgi:CubicO group peptidase (beta-lactamase class C family)
MLEQITGWDVPHAAAAVIHGGRVREAVGDAERRFPLASITKLFTSYAALLAVEEGVLDLDAPAGPPGATVRHLLAHAAGYGFAFQSPAISAPGRRRIYSNHGMEVLADTITAHTGMPFRQYLAEGVLGPLELANTTLDGSPAAGMSSTINDLVRFVGELRSPRLLAPETLASAVSVQFPGLNGVLPGFGSQRPLDWGLGFELRGTKRPHWMGTLTSPQTFGHFGGSGTFLWLDPTRDLGCVCLTDRRFGDWAVALWPPLSDAVVRGAT